MPEITVTVAYQKLDTPAEMAEALAEALTRGYYGTITGMKDDQVEPPLERWALVLNTPTNIPPVTVRMGDVLLWDGAQYQGLDEAAFNERYGGS